MVIKRDFLCDTYFPQDVMNNLSSIAWPFVYLIYITSRIGRFMKTNISQGSVATRIRCGRLFNETLLQIYCRVRHRRFF